MAANWMRRIALALCVGATAMVLGEFPALLADEQAPTDG